MIVSLSFCLLLVDTRLAITFGSAHPEQNSLVNKGSNSAVTLLSNFNLRHRDEHRFARFLSNNATARKKRSSPHIHIIAYIGYRAWRSLLEGSRRLTDDFVKPGEYVKPGDYPTAVSQFLKLNPSDVKEVQLPDGVSMVTGRIGDRRFIVKSAAEGEQGKASITTYVDKAIQNQKHKGKLIYMGKKKIKPNSIP